MQPQWDRIAPTIGIIISIIVVVYEWHNYSFEALVPSDIVLQHVLKHGSFRAVVDPSFEWEDRLDKSIGLTREPMNVSDGFNHALLSLTRRQNDNSFNFAYSVFHCFLADDGTSFLVYSDIYEDRCDSVRYVLNRSRLEGDCVFKTSAAYKVWSSIRFILAAIAMAFFTTLFGLSHFWWELKVLWNVIYEHQMANKRAYDTVMDEDERLWLQRRAAQNELRDAIEVYIWEIRRNECENSTNVPWDHYLSLACFVLILILIVYIYEVELHLWDLESF